ncbi:hypothetical protein EDB85DRAFT_2019137, partial [Lactarius pseudohatsudake]
MSQCGTLFITSSFATAAVTRFRPTDPPKLRCSCSELLRSSVHALYYSAPRLWRGPIRPHRTNSYPPKKCALRFLIFLQDHDPGPPVSQRIGTID